MTKLRPVSRRELIQRLRLLHFDGPFCGGRHFFMSRDAIDVRIPNPHQSDISVDLLIRLLRQAGVSRKEWLGE
jgi:hypothetical protein